MAEIEFSKEASSDVDDIAAFSVKRFGERVAESYLTGLELIFASIAEFPEMSAIYPRLRPAVRCRVYRSHRIFYRVVYSRVLIVRILHHARDVNRAKI
jgi:toxin ParE1/3/4